MPTRVVFLLIALWAALLASQPVAAQDLPGFDEADGGSAVAYIHPRYGAVLMVSVQRGATEADAKADFDDLVDAAEHSRPGDDLYVRDTERLSRSVLREIGADEGMFFDASSGGTSLFLYALLDGQDISIVIYGNPSGTEVMDGDAMMLFLSGVVSYGLDVAPPRGFVDYEV